MRMNSRGRIQRAKIPESSWGMEKKTLERNPASSFSIVYARAETGEAGNTKARRTETRHNFTPFYPCHPLYEFREQLGWDDATGLRLCESWVKRDRNYARAADGDKAAIQELHFPKLQQPVVYLSLFLPPFLFIPLFLSPPLWTAIRSPVRSTAQSIQLPLKEPGYMRDRGAAAGKKGMRESGDEPPLFSYSSIDPAPRAPSPTPSGMWQERSCRISRWIPGDKGLRATIFHSRALAHRVLQDWRNYDIDRRINQH